MVKNFFFYLILEMGLLVACSFGDDECGFADAREATVGSLEARNIEYTAYNKVSVLQPNDTLQEALYAIWMVANPEYLTDIGGGYQSLMACTPPSPVLLDQIDSIKVHLVGDAVENFTSGSDVSDHFYFMTDNETEVPIEDTAMLNGYFTSDFYLFLVTDLEFEEMKKVVFEVRVFLRDKGSYRLTTNPVYLY